MLNNHKHIYIPFERNTEHKLAKEYYNLFLNNFKISWLSSTLYNQNLPFQGGYLWAQNHGRE